MILIKNAKLLTMAEKDYEQGQILINDGKIVAIGKDIVISDHDVDIIDAAGAYVTPGLIDPHCHIGLWEDGMGEEGADGNEETDPVTPHLRAIDGVNPFDPCFKEAYENGITSVVTGPGSGNVIGGQFVAMKTFGRRIEEMIIKEPAAMKIAFGENPKRVYSDKDESPTTRMAMAAILRENLIKAQEYQEKLDQAEEDEEIEKPDFDMKLDALCKVLNGDLIV
jgi:imidazolonepropionase-like amidohydrolase